MDSTQWPRLNYTKCVDGFAQAIPDSPLHKFRCKNIDLYDFINHATLGSPNTDYRGKSGASSWGWWDVETGREFIGEFANGCSAAGEFLYTNLLQLPACTMESALSRFFPPVACATLDSCAYSSSSICIGSNTMTNRLQSQVCPCRRPCLLDRDPLVPALHGHW